MSKYHTPNFPGVPEQVWDDLEYEIARSGLECADSFRAYRKSDEHLKEEFLRAVSCCGEFETHTIVNGEKWIIGCNHGH